MARNPIQSLIIDTRRSMAIVDPNKFPNNLGKTPMEDSPEQSLPALAMEAYNVLPTVLGYKSAFRPRFLYNAPHSIDAATVAEESVINKQPIQDILVYQTAPGYRVHIAMTAQGLWGWVAWDDSAKFVDKPLKQWRPLINIDPGDGYKLWTNCTIDNVTYFYAQGLEVIWALADLATARNMVERGGIMRYESEELYFGIVEAAPNFLNMEGQIGIFKAGNRLGFWDSDNATAWSSAINKLDFTPDATTFAGITTFSDVVGRITSVHGQGTGFVIYSTGSIVLCLEMPDSVEKFSGRAISKGLGVLYPSQVALTNVDDRHYVWTSAGLAIVDGGAVELIEAETSRYLMEKYPLVGLRVINGTHICIQAAPSYTEVNSAFNARVVVDGDGIPGWFRPVPEERPSDYREYFRFIFEGASSKFQEEWGEATILELPPAEPDHPKIHHPEPLVPLWDGVAYNGVIGGFGLTIPARENMFWSNHSTGTTNTPIPSSIYPGGYYSIDYKHSTTPSFDVAGIDWEFPINFPGLADSKFERLLSDELDAKLAEVYAAATADLGKIDRLLAYGPQDEKGWWSWTNVNYHNMPTACFPKPAVQGQHEPTEFDSPETILPNCLWRTFTEIEDTGCEVTFYGEVVDVRMRLVSAKAINEPWANCPEESGGSLLYTFTSGTSTLFANIEIEPIPGTERKVILMQMWVSAWARLTGLSGTRYRISRFRPRNTPCRPYRDPHVFTLPENVRPDFQNLMPESSFSFMDFYARQPPLIEWGGGPSEPSQGQDVHPAEFRPNYPAHNPIWATFQKGLVTPEYPAYARCYILDTRLDKWGIFNTPHSIFYDLRPRNVPDSTVLLANNNNENDVSYIPEFPVGAVLTTSLRAYVVPSDSISKDYWHNYYQYMDNHPVLLTGKSMFSRITYGKVGMRRAGITKVTGIQASAGGDNATIFLRASLDDSTTRPLFAYKPWVPYAYESRGTAVALRFRGHTDLPILSVGRWFKITVLGDFDLNSMVLYGKPEGRLRYTFAPEEPAPYLK